MRVILFCHSIISDWNHGNAHFLRGIVAELQSREHSVSVFEPYESWSLRNLIADHGEKAVESFHQAYPEIHAVRYLEPLDLDRVLEGADLVIVHEWNPPQLVQRIGRHRAQNGRYRLLFHDTHHRSVTDPAAMKNYDLDGYDGVLAFGNSVAEQYRKNGWAKRVWTWHEAADTRMFFPRSAVKADGDLVWIGNWGDGERTEELREFLIRPIRELGLRARIHGVRYPPAGLHALRESNIEYGGWMANYEAPLAYSRFRVTVHVPRRPYVRALPGIPTIRVFEALSCGIPLVCAPWDDTEHLFTPGKDFAVANNGAEMSSLLKELLSNSTWAAELANHGRETILSRHTCAHRVDELMRILEQLEPVDTVCAATELSLS
jgi:spore maturation protein CgeB